MNNNKFVSRSTSLVDGVKTFPFSKLRGKIENDDYLESISDAKNFLKIMFYIDKEQAKSALDTIQKITTSCEQWPFTSCMYSIIGNNCIDFMQKIFESSGGRGDFASYHTDEQLTFSLTNTYVFIRSRDVSHYLNYKIGSNINKISNIFAPILDLNNDPYALPKQHFINYIVQEASLAENKSSLDIEANGQNYLPFKDIQKIDFPIKDLNTENQKASAPFTPTYQGSLASDILLGVVLIKAASKTYNFFSDIWSKTVGEKVEVVDHLEWMRRQETQLSLALDELDSIAEKIDEGLVNIDIQINSKREKVPPCNSPTETILWNSEKEISMLDVLNKDRKALGMLWSKYIDLQFEAIELEEEFNNLKYERGLPTKTHAAKLEKQISGLYFNSNQFFNGIT